MMARTAQILVLFLFAVCAVQCYSSNRHGYSSGRSHSHHYNPRHRSYGRHGSSHSRLHSSSGADPDTSVSSTPIALLKEKSPSNDILRRINLNGKSGDNNQDNRDTINIDGSTPGSGENDLDAGTINVGGLSPNSNGNDKLPFGNDNGIMPGGVQNTPNNSDNPINVNGFNPGDNIDGNPSHDGNTNKTDNLLPYDGGDNNQNNNSIKIDGLTPNDNKHIPNINPGTIDINGKPLDKNGPGPDNENIKVNGMLPNENNKPIHDNGPNESKSKPDHNSGNLIVNGLPNKNNVGGQPGNNQPDKNNVHLNYDKSTIGDKNGSNNDHNTIKFDGLTPGRRNNVPDTRKLPINKNERPHNINVHGSSPDVDGDNPKHNDHTNDNGLLPGGDSNNSNHGIDDKDKGGLTNSGKPIHDNKNVDGSKPTGYKPHENNSNDNVLPAGGEGGVHKELPNENRRYRPNGSNSGNFNRPGYPSDHNNNWNPSEKRPGYQHPREPYRRPDYNTHENNFRPHFHGNLDNKGGNDKYPVYLPDGQAIYPSGIISQNSKMPAFYIVMINGQPTLVKNPAAANEKDDSIDIDSILGQLGVGGISMGSLNGLVPNWLQLGEGIKGAGIGMLPQPFVIGSRYPTVTGFNFGNRMSPGSVLVNGFPTGSVSPLIPGEQQINVEPVIAEPVPVQQPIITESVSQPIYTIPVPPQNPGGIYGYPSTPYPAPWPAMWDSMNPTMNWPSIFDFLVNLGAHLPHHKTPHEGGTIDKNTGGTIVGNHKIQNPSEGGNSIQPGGKNVNTIGNTKDKQHPSNPALDKNRDNAGDQSTNSTSGTDHPGINNKPLEPGSNNSTESPVFRIPNNNNPTVATPQPNNKPTEHTPHPYNNKPTEQPTQSNNKPTEQTPQPNNKPTEQTPQRNNKPTEQTTQSNHKPTEQTPQPNNKPTEQTPQPNNKPTEQTPQPNNKPTEQTPQPNNKPTEQTPQPNNKPTEQTPQPNNKPIKQTPQPNNKPTEQTPKVNNYKPTEKTLQPTTATPTNPDLTNFKDLTNPGNDNTGLHIPVPYDPTLVNLLNVVLKLPNRGLHPRTKPIQKPSPFENNPALLPNRQPSTADKTINDLLEILKSNAGDKAFKELIELVKSKSGDKDIKDLLSVLKPNTNDKTLHELLQILRSHPGGKNIHNLLALLNHHGDRNEPNPAVMRQILRHLLDSYNQPNMNVLVEPGMDEATRSSLILLLNLLANNLGNEYSSGMGFGGLYEQMNPANLYFLGHYPCDYGNIHGIAGGQSKGLWQLLSHMYGMGNLHNIRLDRSAEEDDDIKPSTPIPNTDDMKR